MIRYIEPSASCVDSRSLAALAFGRGPGSPLAPLFLVALEAEGQQDVVADGRNAPLHPEIGALDPGACAAAATFLRSRRCRVALEAVHGDRYRFRHAEERQV